MLAVIIVVAVVVILALVLIVVSNGLVRSRRQVDNAWSQIDVQMKRRIDLVPDPVGTVSGVAGHREDSRVEQQTRAVSSVGF